jgi:tRNA-specific 2-thiouridylase
VRIDAATHTITLGPRRALEAPGLVTEPVNWLVPRPLPAASRVEVQIRHRHRPAPARLAARADGRVEVRFETPQTAVTPGQSCVFYDGDRVLGGAPIAVVLAAEPAPAHPDPALA